MTASEARKLTISKLRDEASVRECILTMAEAGRLYATLETAKIQYPAIYAANLEKDGYTVVMDDKHFSITW